MDLQKIGKEIVRKCKGLPLAAQSIGGLLRRKCDIRDWYNILNSNIWENESKIIPALKISYHYLPPCLKRCFVYCSLYPKDYEFDRDDLILLWMAEDLLRPSKNGKTLEEVGYGYFNDLASRSFFQRSGNENQSFVMHDLVHDLATFLDGEFYFRTEELGKETKIGTNTRHLSFSEFSDPILESFDIFCRANHLRTFLTINVRPPPFNNEKASCIILSNLKCLRVLSFHNSPYFDALPASIDELIHLRYLNLSSTAIKTLPESLCNLYNLQTLKLCNCKQLSKLPNDMQNLVNLRHLNIIGTSLEQMPRKMSKLNHLQHLSYFVVDKHEEKGIKELRTLSNLHGSLFIKKLENVNNGFEASEAKIMDKEYLDELWFLWSRDANDHFTNSQSEMDILCKLQPSKNLKRLGIHGYRGTRFPEWVGDSSYHNLVRLFLTGCSNCCIIPPLGQLQTLKYLAIADMCMLETVGSEYGDTFSGTSFPSLEHLEFDDMPCWQVWHHPHDSYASFPVVKSLMICNCPRLRGNLPSYLPALETIQIEQCGQLSSSLPRASSIRTIEICDSNNVALHELPLSLKELRIQGKEVTKFVFEAISIAPLSSLHTLDIRDCSFEMSFPGDCLPASLKSLSIMDCRNLDFPQQNRQHESLRYLSIDRSCKSLTTLSLETLPNLYHLNIRNCENIKCLSISNILQNLVTITIKDCPNFVSFPEEGLPAPNLTSLYVSHCINLKSLPCHANTLLPNLQRISVSHCPEIEVFPEGGMPPSLRRLCVVNCEKLLRCPPLTSMDMLISLEIEGPCDGVESFPKKVFALLPPSLIFLTLRNLSSMHTLECTGLLHLTSLQILRIVNCPMLENMTGEILPASLVKLQISKCPLLKERCSMKHQQIFYI